MIRVNAVSKRYEGTEEVLLDISFDIEEGEVICILGQSGSGKSTLLKVLAGLEDADHGEVKILNEVITGPSNNLVPGYDFIHYVAQDYALPPFKSIYDTLDAELYYTEEGQPRKDKIKKMLQLCHLEGLENAFPRELSGGERQRAAIAVALADDPEVILLDEPFSNLDGLLKSEVRKEIFQILKDSQVTAVLVSHDPSDALALADRIIVIQDGRIVQEGRPEEIYHQPASEYVAKMLGPINYINISGTKENNNNTLALRPERFKISSKGTYEGTVVTSKFHGMHYQILIDTQLSVKHLLMYSDKPIAEGSVIKFDITSVTN